MPGGARLWTIGAFGALLALAIIAWLAFAPFETVTETYDSASGRLNHKETSVDDLTLIITASVLFSAVAAFTACFYAIIAPSGRGGAGDGS